MHRLVLRYSSWTVYIMVAHVICFILCILLWMQIIWYFSQIGIDMKCFPTLKSDLDFTVNLVSEQSVFCLPGKVSNFYINKFLKKYISNVFIGFQEILNGYFPHAWFCRLYTLLFTTDKEIEISFISFNSNTIDQSWKKHFKHKYTILNITSNPYIHNVICCNEDRLICKICVDWRNKLFKWSNVNFFYRSNISQSHWSSKVWDRTVWFVFSLCWCRCEQKKYEVWVKFHAARSNCLTELRVYIYNDNELQN